MIVVDPTCINGLTALIVVLIRHIRVAVLAVVLLRASIASVSVGKGKV